MRAGRAFFLGALLAGVGLGGAVSPPAEAQKRQRDLITAEEIRQSAHKDQDLFQIVRSLRPHFLATPRGVRSIMNGGPAPVVLYVDDQPRSGLDELKLIKPEEVEEIRYLNPGKAQDLYGITHSGGAVLVKLKSRGQGPGTRREEAGGTLRHWLFRETAHASPLPPRRRTRAGLPSCC